MGTITIVKKCCAKVRLYAVIDCDTLLLWHKIILKVKNSKWHKNSTLLIAIFFCVLSFGQKQDLPESEVEFWDRVQFGGGAGLAIGSEFTSISVSPQAAYSFNQYFAAGVGLNAGYIRERNLFKAQNYGMSLLGLFSPTSMVQISAELNQTYYTYSYEDVLQPDEQFWDTALFLGVGYTNGNVTLGVQYDVLFDRDRSPNGSPLMPFVRVFF